ncbi:hypothetical protein [Kitasatospora sp. NPDC018619]|uniref:hypothetical protein n=1 Tax=unclassified Kitasatospora TaxID=2633591 RepID=UPI00379EABC3
MGSAAVHPEGRPAATGGARVRDVVRDVVAEAAAEELPLVVWLTRFDDASAVRRLAGRGRSEPLGFGLGEVAALVTPVVWLALDQVGQKLAGAAVDGAAKGLKAGLRRVFRKGAEPVTIPPLTREQLADVRRSVLESAAQRGMAEDRAAAIADAVVARLALAEPGGGGHEPAGLAAGGDGTGAGAQGRAEPDQAEPDQADPGQGGDPGQGDSDQAAGGPAADGEGR